MSLITQEIKDKIPKGEYEPETYLGWPEDSKVVPIADEGTHVASNKQTPLRPWQLTHLISF
jgi:hypothetical protein